MSDNKRQSATARAPASVGNVAVGFDIMGHALVGAADQVTAHRVDQAGVTIQAITGVADNLPMTAADNCAGKASLALLAAVDSPFGVNLEIEKGIPLSSGMGGSAASSVAAVAAVNALLDEPLASHSLIPFALEGERLAAGEPHPDNIAPCLLGGLILMLYGQPVRLPVPEGLHCVLVHPHLEIATRDARQRLLPLYELKDVIDQNTALAGFISACYQGDVDLIAHTLQDHIAEPRRAELLPGFQRVKKAALLNGALGCSFSGSGPSMFAWCRDETDAGRCGQAMAQVFNEQGIKSETYVSPVDAPGVELI